MKRTACLIVLAAAMLGTGAHAQQAGAPSVERGRVLYQSVGCWQCHGTTAAGGAWQGPRLAPNPVPFTAFLGQLRRPVGSMPPYRAAVLTDAAAADIHAFLGSIPKGPAADQIELLRRK